MKLRVLIGTAVVVAVSALVTSQAISQSGEGTQSGQPSQEEMMKAMEEYTKLMQPGDHHKRLGHFVGDWDVTIKTWMGGPGKPPTESTGKSSVEWILGKRFIRERVEAEMKWPDFKTGEMQTMPFEGFGTYGYDNYENMYVGTWCDNMGTALHYMRGSADPSGKRFTYYFTMDEPGLKVQDRMVKTVIRVINDNKHVFEMYDLHAGDDYKVMEFAYTRSGA